jgi:hypothetical protein
MANRKELKKLKDLPRKTIKFKFLGHKAAAQVLGGRSGWRFDAMQ